MTSPDPKTGRPAPREGYPARKARQGDIVLRHTSSRWIFIAALAIAAFSGVIVVALSLLA